MRVDDDTESMLDIERALVMPFDLEDPHVCVTCRGVIHGQNSTLRECENCLENAATLDGINTPIIPISLYSRDSVLRTWLTYYKPDIDNEHGEIGESPSTCVGAMTRLFSRFFEMNRQLLADVDLAVVVPSTRRPPPHPLEEILSLSIAGDVLLPGALVRTEHGLDHRHANMLAYEASEQLANKRVLIIDDVYASGARLQSAAAAIRRRGGAIAHAVVAARRINPGYHASIQSRWDAALEVPFAWARQIEGNTC